MINIDKVIKEFIDKPTQTKGKRIFNNQPIVMKVVTEGLFHFEITSESDDETYYDVEIDFASEPDDPDYDDDTPIMLCDCPLFNYEGEICKHIVACLLYLQEKLESSEKLQVVSQAIPEKKQNIFTFGNSNLVIESPDLKPIISYNQRYNRVYLYEYEILSGLQSNIKRAIIKLIDDKKVRIVSETKEKSLVGAVLDKNIEYLVQLKRYPDDIRASCSCKAGSKTLCNHTRALLYYILTSKRDQYYLDSLVDSEQIKTLLLAQKGIKIDEPEAEYYNFGFFDGEYKLKPKSNLITDFSKWELGKTIQKSLEKNVKRAFSIPEQIADNHIFVLKIHKDTPIIRWDIHPIYGSPSEIISSESKIKINSLEELKRISADFASLLYNFTPKGVIADLKENDLISSYYYNDDYELNRNMSDAKLIHIKNFFINTLKTNIEKLIDSNQFFIKKNNSTKPKAADLEKLTFSENYFKLHLKVIEVNKFVKVSALILIEDKLFELSDFTNNACILLIKNNTAYIPNGENDWKLLLDFTNKNEIVIPASEAPKLYKNYLLPLRNIISIDLPEKVIPISLPITDIKLAVRLKEMEPNFLLIQPIIVYNNIEAELDNQIIQVYINNQLNIIDRDFEKESNLKSLIENLHPNFKIQTEQEFYYLKFAEATKNGWFFESIKMLIENGIEIYGQKELKKFKYNTNKPKLDIKGKSGIDWFDLKIEISFGDQIVPLKALKQAILNKQDFILLGDGTMGLLPEEWFKKFKSLFHLGNIRNEEELQVSKFHYTLIDELHGEISDLEILKELALKKQQLNQIQFVKELSVPKNIKATLRPYQLAGFNWFNQLHQIGWGGCLADDMGLGKTLQTLCYLQELYNNDKKLKALIVCPTSLIYNWQAELDKFTKGINYQIYHGTEREFPQEVDSKWNLIITTYGTMRNDIEKFSKINFNVTILDESQSIKNPTSQVTKAVALINTKIRFILSGTPVQNNTFDLYSQLNFVNPGILGNQEFFKTEFANPIDKNGDKEASEKLRKMVFPFIMRRTKEQVAKDLPDKTETILFCEMGKYQQKVYDSVKEDYRLRILGKMEEVGIAKSAFLILEGLNKLRQICDCPSLIGTDDKNRFKQESIKLNELMREIEENISDHKMLVFSQFLGMLDLIKQKLDTNGVKYIYLDGSTPAKERGRLVEQFQTDASIQVFLISLKAGGVGLNLTAADYVYVIDPWWNPAVEDQAIDRTHRIGQTKKIFAYKLICKNSIEEKIIQLQEKKKSLAKELISEDASFVKKLTKEDVAWLLA